MKLDEIKLKKEIALRGWTQMVLSSRSGVSCVTLSKIYNGGSCSTKIAKKIVSVLDLELKDMIKE